LNEFGEPDVSGLWVGLVIGFAIVVVVVVVVGVLLMLASRINAQAGAAVRLLAETRTATQPLEELARTNELLQSILRGASSARQALGG
jgi:Sec-independent protein translocase protein TatA